MRIKAFTMVSSNFQRLEVIEVWIINRSTILYAVDDIDTHIANDAD